MSTFKSFCFIPAKGASKRLKKKNILKLDGKELIYYPIHNAIESGLFDPADIILSTESEEIKNIAESYGANVPYLRDEKLAHDPYGIIDVVLDFLENTKYKTYDAICVLLPTAPMMIKDDILAAHQLYSQGRFGSVMSVTPFEHSPLRSVFLKDGLVDPLFEKMIFKKSQELEPTFRLNGAVAFLNIKQLLKDRIYFLRPWGAIQMPAERSLDIDNEEGYLYAKYLLQSRKS